jgi:predicted tellurium resistance membrane protein TerC
MFQELRSPAAADVHEDIAEGGPGRKTFGKAVGQIVIADVSMSLDNVLAVAGAAQQDMAALVFGLILSVVLMGLAASQIAKLMARFAWIGWVGLVIVAYVAGTMIWEGSLDLIG